MSSFVPLTYVIIYSQIALVQGEYSIAGRSALWFDRTC